MARTVPGAILSLADGAAHYHCPECGRVSMHGYLYARQHVVLSGNLIRNFSCVTLTLMTDTLWMTALCSRNLCRDERHESRRSRLRNGT